MCASDFNFTVHLTNRLFGTFSAFLTNAAFITLSAIFGASYSYDSYSSLIRLYSPLLRKKLQMPRNPVSDNELIMNFVGR